MRRLFAIALLASCSPPPSTGGDAGLPDAGPADSGSDAGMLDDGRRDGGPDSGVPDAGARDAGVPDAGVPDAGVPDAGARAVDPSTLEGKLIFGYQGWFLCPNDGAPPNRWVHWFRSNLTPTVDLWPDTRELDAGELCPTPLTRPDGGPAYVYSAWRPQTVDRHFAWMEQNDLDGVMLQRFLSELADPAFKTFRDRVAGNVRSGAEAHGRVFAMMYDISGANASTLVADLKSDWSHLVNTLGLTQSPRYLKHRGRPLLAIWGPGFSDRPGTVADAQAMIDWFTRDAPANERVTLMVGVPRSWRDDATWAPVLKKFDVVSPWTVGSYVDDPGADSYRARLAGDLALAADAGFQLMPVVWPGFSWTNLNAGPLNQIPRRGGRFWWRQLYNAKLTGATMVYGAMFDEVDEGTAMFKTAETAGMQPTQYPFLPLDADGEALPSDFYLRLAREGGRMLRGELPLSPTRP